MLMQSIIVLSNQFLRHCELGTGHNIIIIFWSTPDQQLKDGVNVNIHGACKIAPKTEGLRAKRILHVATIRIPLSVAIFT